MKESTVDWLDKSKSWKQQCHEQRVAEEKRNREKRAEYEAQLRAGESTRKVS